MSATSSRARYVRLLAVAASAVVAGVLLYLPFGGTSVLVALLTAGLFGTAISLGAAVVIAGCVLTGARWWRPIRTATGALAGLLPVPLAILAVVLALGREQLYPWTSDAVIRSSPLLQEKVAWLSDSFFLFRGFLVLVLWWALTRWVRGTLQRSVEAPGPASRRRLVRASVAFVLLLAPTLSIASWDWAMSLEPAWFSTMYGVYLFSGFFLAGLAALAALVSVPGGFPGLPDVSASVRHDLGKLIFAFAAFWAYIWYCQYMLIWYANLPEEATYFTLRLSPEWATLFWLVPVLSFVVPFLVLLPAATKRHPPTLFQVSLAVLAGRWLDLYVMVAPPVRGGPGVPVLATAVSLVLVAAMLLWLRRSLGRHAVARQGSFFAPDAEVEASGSS